MKKSKVLCIPGWDEGCRVFDKIKDYLKDYIDSIYVELPGFNNNGLPNKAYTPFDYASYVNNLNLEFDYILAHSYGGKVALEYYFNFQKVKLIFLGPSIITPHKSLFTKLKIIKYKVLKRLNLLNKYKEYGSVDYQNAKGVMKETFRIAIKTYYDSELEKIEDDTLLIYGKNDKKTPISEGKRITKRIRNSKLEIIDGDHFMMLNNASMVSKLIYRFTREDK